MRRCLAPRARNEPSASRAERGTARSPYPSTACASPAAAPRSRSDLFPIARSMPPHGTRFGIACSSSTCRSRPHPPPASQYRTFPRVRSQWFVSRNMRATCPGHAMLLIIPPRAPCTCARSDFPPRGSPSSVRTRPPRRSFPHAPSRSACRCGSTPEIAESGSTHARGRLAPSRVVITQRAARTARPAQRRKAELQHRRTQRAIAQFNS